MRRWRRNPDEEIRELERRLRSSGLQSDAAALARALHRAGLRESALLVEHDYDLVDDHKRASAGLVELANYRDQRGDPFDLGGQYAHEYKDAWAGRARKRLFKNYTDYGIWEWARSDPDDSEGLIGGGQAFLLDFAHEPAPLHELYLDVLSPSEIGVDEFRWLRRHAQGGAIVRSYRYKSQGPVRVDYFTDMDSLQSAWHDLQSREATPPEPPADAYHTYNPGWVVRMRHRGNPIPYIEPGWLDTGSTMGPVPWAYLTVDLVRLLFDVRSPSRPHQVLGRRPIARIDNDSFVRVYSRIKEGTTQEAAHRAWERWKRRSRDYALERRDGYDEEHTKHSGWFALDVLGAFDAVWAVLGPPHPLEAAWPPLGGPEKGEEREFELLEPGPTSPPSVTVSPLAWEEELERHSTFWHGGRMPRPGAGRRVRHHAIEADVHRRLAEQERVRAALEVQKQPWWAQLEFLADSIGTKTVAKHLNAQPSRIEQWLEGSRGVSKRTAMNIGRLYADYTEGRLESFMPSKAPPPRVPGPPGGGMVSRGHTREIGKKRIPFWLGALREMRNLRFPGRGGGRRLAKHIGISPVSLTNMLKGRRVPGPEVMKKIMRAVGKKMPDWKKALQKAVDQHPSQREAAEAIGIAPGTLHQYLSGRSEPSEKTMERIFAESGMKGFWVTVGSDEETPRREAETGARTGLAMGEVPTESFEGDPYAQAALALLPLYRSQRAMAKDVGVTVAVFNRWLAGEPSKHPSGATVVKLRAALVKHGLPVPEEIRARFEGMEPRLRELLAHYSSQSALSRDLGTNPSWFTLVLTGRRKPTKKQDAAINRLLRKKRKEAAA